MSDSRRSAMTHPDVTIEILGEEWLSVVWDSPGLGWLVLHAFTRSLFHLVLKVFTGL